MGFVEVENIKVFAYHGCLPEETIIGSDYRVDVKVKADLSLSCLSDKLKDTVDYVLLNRIVVEEMKKPSKLLETVALRIVNSIFNNCKTVNWCSVSVAKINPPLGGDVEKVIVRLEKNRE
tara:strand:- start:128 stop:487 length:360 start_codon:yes stop_codon:yes gene_type:complete